MSHISFMYAYIYISGKREASANSASPLPPPCPVFKEEMSKRYAKDALEDSPRKKRRLAGSGGHSNASDLSALQIGAKKTEDDAPFPSNANATSSIYSTRTLPITHENFPSLTTYAARTFADNLVNIYKTEEDGQAAREWLKELPEHTLMKVWKMLIDRWPGYLTSAFISAVRH